MTNKIKIDAVIFDFGGVITYPQDSQVVNGMAELIGVKTEEVLTSYNACRDDYDSNNVTAKQYWGKILTNFKIPNSEALIEKLIILDIKSWTSINNKVLNYIYRLKAQKIKIAIISNMPKDELKYISKEYGWLKYFDSAIWSCKIGINKPSPEIYKTCLKELNLPANKCVFIDDSDLNVSSAKKIGLNCIHFKNYKQFRSDFKNRYFLNL